MIRSFDSALRQSILHARENHREALEYARQFARELDIDVIEKHVETFVNDFSLDIGEQGMAAVARLEEISEATGILR